MLNRPYSLLCFPELLQQMQADAERVLAMQKKKHAEQVPSMSNLVNEYMTVNLFMSSSELTKMLCTVQ